MRWRARTWRTDDGVWHSTSGESWDERLMDVLVWLFILACATALVGVVGEAIFG